MRPYSLALVYSFAAGAFLIAVCGKFSIRAGIGSQFRGALIGGSAAAD
jgi:hypothetical protein